MMEIEHESAPSPLVRPPMARVFDVVRHIPASLAMISAIVICGIVWRGLWEPFTAHPVFDVVAYGAPAFAEGRWWTAVTGVFFVAEPWVYLPTLLGLWGLVVLEYLKGWRVAMLYFWLGNFFALFATALLLSFGAMFPNWEWAHEQVAALDVGASAGAFACMGAVAGLLRAPWRVRLWLVLLAASVVALFFLGTIADVEHLLALVFVLIADRSLRVQRTTVREQRLVAFIGMLSFAAISVMVSLLPIDGPFGASDPLGGSFWSTALDVVVIVLIANGLRRAKRWAWWVAVALMLLNILSAVLFLIVAHLGAQAGAEATVDGSAAVEISSGALAAVLLVYLLWVRRVFRPSAKGGLGGAPTPTRADAEAAILAHGGGTLSWMTGWEPNQYARTSTGMVAYQRRLGVALALADPLGPEAGRAASVQEFIEDAERAGLVPCFFGAGEATRTAVPETWRSLVVADDTIVDLPGVEFTGKPWAQVRTSLNRAGREGMTFRMTTWDAESWGVHAQLQAISAMWVGDKGLPEMGFTLGTLEQTRDPRVRLALALSPNGDVDGFLSWLPVYGQGESEGAVVGWTLDLMRRRDGGFPPVMEYLIGMSIASFRDEGAQFMSLSGAPLAHTYPPEARLISDLSERLASALEPVYGFRSLHRFKEKFNPRYETMYLLFRDETDLPRIGAGLTRAFLPEATLRQFAGAGRDLIRR